MPSTITEQSITFDHKRLAKAVFPKAGDKARDIINALDLGKYEAVLLIIGAADNIVAALKPKLTELFSRGIARAARRVNAVIIDGGTKAGVMELMGQGVADQGYESTLIGVAPVGQVNYPGSTGAGKTPLDPNHSHFVLVPGNTWGSETGRMFELVEELKINMRVVAVVAGGGKVALNETLHAVRQAIPLIVIEGSGGLADEIAAARRTQPDLPSDSIMAEIIAKGRIAIHPLSNSAEDAEGLVVRALGGG